MIQLKLCIHADADGSPLGNFPKTSNFQLVKQLVYFGFNRFIWLKTYDWVLNCATEFKLNTRSNL